MTVRAVLLDADGVMQANPPGWIDDVTTGVADAGGFAQDLFASERAAMVGERPFVDVLHEVCGRWHVEGGAGHLLHQWRRVEVSPGMVGLVRRLRAGGTPCHLVSNQNDVRAAFLRDDCGYGDLFDSLFLSCELGALKDDPAYWAEVVAALGVPAGDLLVVDDGARYVDTARRCGLRGAQWTIDDGQRRLGEILAAHGVTSG